MFRQGLAVILSERRSETMRKNCLWGIALLLYLCALWMEACDSEKYFPDSTEEPTEIPTKTPTKLETEPVLRETRIPPYPKR